MILVIICVIIKTFQASHLFILGDFANNDLLNKGTVGQFRELFHKSYKLFKKHVDVSSFTPIQHQTLEIIYNHYACEINTNETNNAIQKLLLGSSKSKNDVSTFSKCSARESFESPNTKYKSNYTYLIVASNRTVKDKSDALFVNDNGDYGDNFLFGLCLRKDILDLKVLGKFIFYVNNQIGFFFNITSDNEILISNMKEVHNMSILNMNYSSIIPAICFIMLLMFVIFPKIPTYAFTFITRKNSNKKDIYDFKRCFNVADNGEILFNLNQHLNEFHNESGLSFIKGIRGVSMIFLLFGNVFLILYKHPTLFVGEIEKMNFIKSNSFAILIFCIRNTPKVLFSCSGFCLAYKLHCFLNEKENASFDFKLLFMNFYYLRFYIYQFHKYIIALLSVVTFKYTLKEVFHHFFHFGPSIEVFIQSFVDKLKLSDILGHFLLYKDITEISFYRSTKQHFLCQSCIMTIFDILFSEITFFTISTCLLIMSYKKQLHFDNIIVISSLVIIFIKCFMMLINPDLNTLLFYFDSYVNRFFTNTLLNYHYYLIGMFFGLVNYVIQKGININDTNINKGVPYLNRPIQVVNYIKYVSNNNKVYLIIWVLLILSSMLFAFNFGYAENTFVYYLLRILSGFDIEIFVVLLHLCVGVSYLKGGDLCYKFISSNHWMIVNKLYFSFIICCKPCVYFILYQSETRIKLGMFSVVFYGLICGFLCFVCCVFLYIVYEMPLKRGSRMIIKYVDRKKKKKKELPKNLIKENLIIASQEEDEDDDEGEGEMIDLDKLEGEITYNE